MTANVSKIMDGIRHRFGGLGYSIKEFDDKSVIHLPHLVSSPQVPTEEHQEQVELLIEICIGEIPATYTIRHAGTYECGKRDWPQFYVEITVPK